MNKRIEEPVYPCTIDAPINRKYGDKTIKVEKYGLTIRDHFAAEALQGLIIKWTVYNEFELHGPDHVAKMAYEFADAMIKRRDRDYE